MDLNNKYLKHGFFKLIKITAGCMLICLIMASCMINSQKNNHRNNLLNVKDHGAKGDGITDDTKAIQDVINMANDKEIVYIPSGVYMVSSLNLKSNLQMEGDSINLPLIKLITSQAKANLMEGDNLENVKLSFLNIVNPDFTIDTN